MKTLSRQGKPEAPLVSLYVNRNDSIPDVAAFLGDWMGLMICDLPEEKRRQGTVALVAVRADQVPAPVVSP